jgi:hypothetical protein
LDRKYPSPSVGGDIAAALTLMAKDRSGPKIGYQAAFLVRCCFVSVAAGRIASMGAFNLCGLSAR